MQEIFETDVAIVGAGPAGTTCALHLASKGIPSILIDKSTFPRDKICGDALSGNTIYELERLGITQPFSDFKEKVYTEGIKFQAPSGESLLLKMKKLRKDFSHAGYVSERIYFDEFLFNMARNNPLIKIIEGVNIQETIDENDEIVLKTKDQKTIVKAKIVVGADGAQSVLSKLTGREMDKKHFCGGLRQYWENVNDLNEGSPIELHFYKHILPGYLWIFPIKGNKANVGIVMRSDLISKRKGNLKTTIEALIKEDPILKERFKNAKPLEEPKGFGLPLGSKRISVSGSRFILLGDAASLIDPFTGEGIGNAMASGRIGADHIENCMREKRFDLNFNMAYDENIYKKLGSELNTGTQLQKLVSRPWLFNWIVKRANKNKHLHEFMEAMLEDSNERKKITKLSFYYKLIFNPKS